MTLPGAMARAGADVAAAKRRPPQPRITARSDRRTRSRMPSSGFRGPSGRPQASGLAGWPLRGLNGRDPGSKIAGQARAKGQRAATGADIYPVQLRNASCNSSPGGIEGQRRRSSPHLTLNPARYPIGVWLKRRGQRKCRDVAGIQVGLGPGQLKGIASMTPKTHTIMKPAQTFRVEQAQRGGVALKSAAGPTH